MNIEELNQQFTEINWQERLEKIALISNKIAFSSSFSIEDQIITYLIFEKKLPIEIFTIDTQRLPEETFKVWHETIEKYKVKILPYFPNQEKLKKYILQNSINAFYQNKELRLRCCEIRKVEPLKKALKNKKIWISGLRREHSIARKNKNFFEYDQVQKIIKFYPIIDLSEDVIWQFIHQKQIPFNSLYLKGYKSIGCSPCTREASDPNDPRSGRWWWENDSHKECGIHFVNNKLKINKNNYAK